MLFSAFSFCADFFSMTISGDTNWDAEGGQTEDICDVWDRVPEEDLTRGSFDSYESVSSCGLRSEDGHFCMDMEVVEDGDADTTPAACSSLDSDLKSEGNTALPLPPSPRRKRPWVPRLSFRRKNSAANLEKDKYRTDTSVPDDNASDVERAASLEEITRYEQAKRRAQSLRHIEGGSADKHELERMKGTAISNGERVRLANMRNALLNIKWGSSPSQIRSYFNEDTTSTSKSVDLAAEERANIATDSEVSGFSLKINDGDNNFVDSGVEQLGGSRKRHLSELRSKSAPGSLVDVTAKEDRVSSSRVQFTSSTEITPYRKSILLARKPCKMRSLTTVESRGSEKQGNSPPDLEYTEDDHDVGSGGKEREVASPVEYVQVECVFPSDTSKNMELSLDLARRIDLLAPPWTCADENGIISIDMEARFVTPSQLIQAARDVEESSVFSESGRSQLYGLTTPSYLDDNGSVDSFESFASEADSEEAYLS